MPSRFGVALIRQGWKRDRRQVETLALDEPQDTVDEFKPLGDRMDSGPTSQAKWSLERLESPKSGATEPTGVA